jgi:hypothetical protein
MTCALVRQIPLVYYPFCPGPPWVGGSPRENWIPSELTVQTFLTLRF